VIEAKHNWKFGTMRDGNVIYGFGKHYGCRRCEVIFHPWVYPNPTRGYFQVWVQVSYRTCG
jgi:hypothetical protein